MRAGIAVIRGMVWALGAAVMLAIPTADDAMAASFDCGNANAEMERLLCSDDGLSKLDDALTPFRDKGP